MNIYILTQEDSFYLPKFFDNFFSQKPNDINIVGVSILKGEIANKNIVKYIRFLRFRGTFKVGFKFISYKIFDIISRIIKLSDSYSVHSAFRNQNVPIKLNHNINADEFVKILCNLNVDLIVSVACPKIIKSNLINNFSNKIINIHGSILPNYRGMLPSFWVLLNNETETGVSVHFVNNNIDDGNIIGQIKIPCNNIKSMHELLLISKIKHGPKLLLDVILKLKSKEKLMVIENKFNGSYFSFPDYSSIKKFYNKGFRVI